MRNPHLLLMLVLTLLAQPVFAKDKPADKLAMAMEVLREIQEIPEQSIPPSLLGHAYGIAVIPEVVKIGFIVGGRHGKGVISVRGEDGRWSQPGFVSLSGGSVGWQVGAQSSDVVLVFKSAKGVRDIAKGKVTLGADIGVAAGPVGREAAMGTDVKFKSEIYSYSRSRGLFVGLSLQGSGIKADKTANATFYQQEGVDLSGILEGKVVGKSSQGRAYADLLNKLAPNNF